MTLGTGIVVATAIYVGAGLAVALAAATIAWPSVKKLRNRQDEIQAEGARMWKRAEDRASRADRFI